MLLSAVAGLIIILHVVNGQYEEAFCLADRVDDDIRDPVCARQLRTLLRSPSFDIPQSVIDELCSDSRWNLFAPLIQCCYNGLFDNLSDSQLILI